MKLEPRDPNHLVHQRPALKNAERLVDRLGDKLCFPAQTIIAEKTVSEVEVDGWV